MLRANANALPSRTQAGLGHSVEALPARKDKSIILKKHRALVLLLKAHKHARSFAAQRGLGSCSGRAQTLRKGAGEDSGPKPDSRDPARAKHVRRAKAQIRTTRANNYGCNSQAAERTKTARLASPLGIPLGASTGATQRRQTLLPKHTVSTRQTRLRLLWPCQPGVFASRLPTRFSYSFFAKQTRSGSRSGQAHQS